MPLSPLQWVLAAPFLLLGAVFLVLIAALALVALVLGTLIGSLVLLVRPDLRHRVFIFWRLLRGLAALRQRRRAADATEARTVIDYED